MRIRIVNTMDGGEIAAEMDPTDSVGDVIVFASQYWKRDRSAFIMREALLLPDSIDLRQVKIYPAESSAGFFYGAFPFMFE